VNKFTAREAHDDALDAHYAGLECLPDHAPTEERPHGCYSGVVFVGHMVADEAGEEVEVFEAFPCKRCAGLV
jgi:hypothetical protein